MNMVKENCYETVTGRMIDLRELTPGEKDCIATVLTRYEAKPGWSEFGAWWLSHVGEYDLTTDSPVRRICDDLEARLGIAQGKIGPPSYRDYLAVLIDEQYGSRYKFCLETGIDQGQLSKVISGKADLSMELLHRVLAHLHATLVVQREETVKSYASPEEASRLLGAFHR